MTDWSVDAIRKRWKIMEQDENKRARIISAAIEVFCASGYEAATMADVAAKAGVAKGTLYLYFDSKESLFKETYRLCYEQRAAACSAHVDEVSGALDKLCLRLKNGTRWELECPLKNRLERIYLAHPRFGERERSKALGMRAQGVEEIFSQGIADGELRDLPPALMEEMYYRLGSALYYYLEEHPDAAQDEGLWTRFTNSLRACLGM